MISATALRLLPPTQCPWPDCGQLVPIAVLVELPGEPPRLAWPVGCYCVMHAVIVGVAAQAHYGGELWYGPRAITACYHAAAPQVLQ